MSFSILTKEDRKLFKEVTGSSPKLLHGFNAHLSSPEKLINNPILNKKGLQVARYLYFNRVFLNSLPSTDQARFYRENGFIQIPNFLSTDEVHKLKAAGALNIAGRLKELDFLFKYTIMDDQLELATHTHVPNDEQYFYHADTFLPCVKVWYVAETVDENLGPLRISPGSCFEIARLLYESSIARGSEILKYSPKVPGSPRLSRLESDQEKVLLDHGYRPSINLMAQPNTLSIMDCRLLHRRSEAPPGTVRAWYLSKCRRFV